MESSTLESPAQTFVTPAWVQDAVFYQIFPDRFARSTSVPKPSNLEPWDSPPTLHGFKGGDLLGVVEHLDYLQDLGVNAIYFCPVFRSTANHRYHTHDYYEIDPILGGNAAFQTLLTEAHGRGMKIVIDGVFNHASRGFFQFNHILENGGLSPYIDWFSVSSWPLHPYGPADAPAGYNAWWGDRSLPEFNTNTPAVRDFLWRVGRHWIEQGVDGWRLDVPNEIDDDAFWREFRAQVKGANPGAYIVGEIWGDARRWLGGDQFDAVMNYLFTRACLGFFTHPAGVDFEVLAGSGLHPLEMIDVETFAGTIDGLLQLYPWQATLAQLNLLDSHDTPRFITMARGDVSALKLAILFQMTFPGAPCIYYGDEIGMLGRHDPDNRRGFDWNEHDWNVDLREYVKRCVALRHANPVLRRGGYGRVYAADDVYAFTRLLDGELAIVALNASTEARTLDLSLPSAIQVREVHDPWGGPAPEVVEGCIRSWTVPARTGAVLLGTAAGG